MTEASSASPSSSCMTQYELLPSWIRVRFSHSPTGSLCRGNLVNPRDKHSLAATCERALFSHYTSSSIVSLCDSRARLFQSQILGCVRTVFMLKGLFVCFLSPLSTALQHHTHCLRQDDSPFEIVRVLDSSSLKSRYFEHLRLVLPARLRSLLSKHRQAWRAG